MASISRTDWRAIVRRIADGKVTPFISDRASSAHLPGQNGLIQAWADDIAYPMVSSFSITRLAQYLSTVSDDLAAKEEYLSFAKRYLVRAVPEKANGFGRSELLRTNLSQLAVALDLLAFAKEPTNPLYVLANLPLPIYITTSYYTFLEEALRTAGKAPRTELCYWRDELRATPTNGSGSGANPFARVREIVADRFDEEELRTLCYDLDVDYDSLAAVGKGGKARELVAYLDRYQRVEELVALGQRQRPDIDWSMSAPDAAVADYGTGGVPSVFELDRNYEPTAEEPLVYHLHGMESVPASLVLTEDDYLDFLVKVSWDNTVIPPRIGEALADSSLLLLGYGLQDWDFRVLFRGLINRKRSSRRLLSVAIQLSLEHEPAEIRSMDEAEEYLEKYFDKANFKIYWGQSEEFTGELWANWNE
ncbi:MAG: SIR2 family protein [Anaerolineae bacterium]|nr:SIR2 family protein [Anaerolineae bacterium]